MPPFRSLGGWRNFPLINVFFDLLFDLPPTPDQLKESLNLIGLIAALLLTMVGAAPYTGTDYAAHIKEVNSTRVFDKFVITTTMSYAGLGAALFGVVAMLLFMGHTSFRGPDGQNSHKLLAVWWRWARWMFLYIFLVMVASIVVAYNANSALLRMTVPHTVSPDDPDYLSTEAGFGGPHPISAENAGKTQDSWLWIMLMYTMLGCGIPLLSAGQFFKTKAYIQMEQQPPQEEDLARFLARAGAERHRGALERAGLTLGVMASLDPPVLAAALKEAGVAGPGGGGAAADRPIADLVNEVTAGKDGITPAQRDFATKMITGLGFADEKGFAAEFPYIDVQKHMPAFPARVEFCLRAYFAEGGAAARISILAHLADETLDAPAAMDGGGNAAAVAPEATK